jgi:hypothetical protein
MHSRRSLLAAFAVLTVSLAQTLEADAGGWCRKADPTRGLAIASPVECPDPCDSPVGGCELWTPYYPGYSPDRRCPVIYGTSAGWYGNYSAGVFGNRPLPYSRGDYGSFTGASRDEASLLRLGGSGPASQTTYRPFHGGAGDLIDRIHGQRQW